MSTAKDLYTAGDLSGAIAEVTREVKASPTDARARTFLFELLCFAGEWDRAARQLDVLASGGLEAEVGVQAYRNAIEAERARARFFEEGARPHFLLEPPEYVSTHLEGLERMRAGDAEGARALIDRAEEARPALPGRLGGEAFDDFRDDDDLVAPALEAFLNDKYTWVPFSQIARLTVPRPSRLRDLLWATVRFETTTGEGGEVLAPALYYGSSAHESQLVRLGRMTDWIDDGGPIQRSAGLRMYLAGQRDYSLFEVDTIEFGASAAANG